MLTLFDQYFLKFTEKNYFFDGTKQKRAQNFVPTVICCNINAGSAHSHKQTVAVTVLSRFTHKYVLIIRTRVEEPRAKTIKKKYI